MKKAVFIGAIMALLGWGISFEYGRSFRYPICPTINGICVEKTSRQLLTCVPYKDGQMICHSLPQQSAWKW